MRSLLLSLFVLFTFGAARAENTAHWIQVTSPHFTVITNGSEKDGRHVASQLEHMRAVFHVLMPAASDDAGVPIVVLALKDKKSFRTLEPESYLQKDQLDLAGLFLSGQDKNYVLLRMDAEGDHPFATVYHEYTHYMLRKAAWLPLWLNEGLAEFYQNSDIQDKSVKVGQPSANDILYLRQNRLLPLPVLLTVDHSSPYYHDEQKGSVFYAESWALTHYLEITDFRQKSSRLHTYVTLLAAHEDPLAAATQAFGDLKKLEQDLSQYIQQSTYQQMQLLAPVAFNEETFTVKLIPETDADSVRADVLMRVGRKKESEDLLTAVLQADPKSALAHEVEGSLHFSEHDLPGARKWYSEAVALDSQNYLSNYYFAVFTLQTGARDQDAAVEKSLQNSTNINPNFAPAYDAFANFYVSRHEKLDTAYGLELRAVQLEPQNLHYRINASAILMDQKQYDNALLILEKARPLAKELNDTQMLESRIEEIEHYKKSMAEMEARRARASADGVSTTETVVRSGVEVSARSDAETAPEYPKGAPTGPQHTVSGVVHGVQCSYPTVLTLNLVTPGKSIALYTNNFFKVPFSTVFDMKDDLLPCTQIDGLKAKIVYGEVKDARVAGQIVSVELSR